MLMNFFTQTPGMRAIAKWVAGMDHARHSRRSRRRPSSSGSPRTQPKNPAGPPVLLFADTFNNFYHPHVARAAVEVLEDAGFRVQVPMADVCCGRPLYDYGFLGMARRWWLHLLRKLQPCIEAGMPMVVLEPSCWAAFKDELTNMLPENQDAKRLQDQTYTLADFLENQAAHYRPPKLHRKAMLHGHCHQKALDTLNDKMYGKLFNEKKLLTDMGVSHREPETGCCGMAGAFGFEAENGHRDISIRCGERVLLPEAQAPRRMRSSLPMGSVARSRSPSRPIGKRCMLRKCCKWPCERGRRAQGGVRRWPASGKDNGRSISPPSGPSPAWPPARSRHRCCMSTGSGRLESG